MSEFEYIVTFGKGFYYAEQESLQGTLIWIWGMIFVILVVLECTARRFLRKFTLNSEHCFQSLFNYKTKFNLILHTTLSLIPLIGCMMILLRCVIYPFQYLYLLGEYYSKLPDR